MPLGDYRGAGGIVSRKQ